MIIDSLENIRKYTELHPLFSHAFDFLLNTELSAIKPGEIEIRDGLKGILMHKNGVSREESMTRFECHRQNIDIQVCLSGTEEMGWKPLSGCTLPKAEFDSEKDVQFFQDHPDMFFSLKSGQFAIFFPEDVHAPMISEGLIQKIVIKVRV